MLRYPLNLKELWSHLVILLYSLLYLTYSFLCQALYLSIELCSESVPSNANMEGLGNNPRNFFKFVCFTTPLFFLSSDLFSTLACIVSLFSGWLHVLAVCFLFGALRVPLSPPLTTPGRKDFATCNM